jgi:hypothetical protein
VPEHTEYEDELYEIVQPTMSLDDVVRAEKRAAKTQKTAKSKKRDDGGKRGRDGSV